MVSTYPRKCVPGNSERDAEGQRRYTGALNEGAIANVTRWRSTNMTGRFLQAKAINPEV